MSQPDSITIPEAGPKQPTAMAQAINASIKALLNSHLGAAAPAYAEAGTFFVKNDANPWGWWFYDGAQWIKLGDIDPTKHTFQVAFRGVEPSINVASSATTDLGSTAITSASVSIQGTTQISSFGFGPNLVRFIQFAGSLTLKNSANLLLPGNADIVTQAGDTALALSDRAGKWRVYHYQRADGRALVSGPKIMKVSADKALTIADSGTIVRFEGASPATLTLPDNATAKQPLEFPIVKATDADLRVKVAAGNFLYTADGTISSTGEFVMRGKSSVVVMASDWDFYVFGDMDTNSGSAPRALSVNANTTLKPSDRGTFLQFTGSSSISALLPSPAGLRGIFYVWNNTSVSQTLGINGAGTFYWPNGSGTTYQLRPGERFLVLSDTFNYIVVTTGGAQNVARTVYTTSATWTNPTANGASPDAEATIVGWGGGGGGGGVSSTWGGGGGGGGCSDPLVMRLGDLPASVPIVIGAGGDPGNPGGDTTFGDYLTAKGGSAGNSGALNSGAAGGAGGGSGRYASDGGAGATTSLSGRSSERGGGGGGGGGNNFQNGGGSSVWGGGGGAGVNTSTGGTAGTSTFGGAGGTAGASPTPGAARGGGGGGRYGGWVPTAGGRGELWITIKGA
ncbi:hypothetical protein [Labrys neptuniae]|uniref:Glycine-rich domain-containing protein n=1 Tax=Labrys neptuniae TaxID=376174 RepID=A0ABV3PGH8_9HYPH